MWPRAGTIVFLDLPRRTVMRRVLARTARRVLRRTELWAGNRETVRNAIAAPDSLIRFTWREYRKYPTRYRALMHDPEWSHLEWVHLRSPREVRQFVTNLRRRGSE